MTTKTKPSMATAWAQQLDRRVAPSWDKLDSGIVVAVRTLWNMGVETCQSCQGGGKHAYPEPTVQFLGGPSAGPFALAIAMQNGLRVTALRRVWEVQDGEPTGPTWEMTFAFAGKPVWWRPRWSR